MSELLKRNIANQPLQPQLVQGQAQDVVEIKNAPEKKKILFLTDTEDYFNELIARNVIKFHPLNFSNRKLVDFSDKCEVLHCNLRDSNCRQWVRTNISDDNVFLKVLLYSKDKTQKWVTELKDQPEIDNVISLREFKKITSFTVPELAEKLSMYTKLSKPDTKFTRLLKFLKKLINLVL